MGLTHVTVTLRPMGGSATSYEADFLVDTGATDSLAPGASLRAAGVAEIGRTSYELADAASSNTHLASSRSSSWVR